MENTRMQPETNDDLSLVRATLLGDRESFARLIDRYKGMVFNLVYRLTGSLADAEDVTQESFIKAYRALESFSITLDFRTWLYTIALNLCRSRLRRRSFLFVSLDKSGADDEGPPFQVADGEKGPEERMLRQEEDEQVQRILKGLPFKYRAVFVLRYIENRSYQDIAALTELPLGTVKTFLFRGQKILMKKLAARRGGDDRQ